MGPVFALIRIVGGSAVFTKSIYTGQGVQLCKSNVVCVSYIDLKKIRKQNSKTKCPFSNVHVCPHRNLVYGSE